MIEREPIAVAPLPQSGSVSNHYTIDADGDFMFPLAPQSLSGPALNPDHLPVITGIPLLDLRPGRETDSAQVRAALGLIRAFELSPMQGLVNGRQIDLSVRGLLVVTTAQSNEVHFALNDPASQLRRWRSLHDYAQRNGRHLMWIDLSVSNNVPARWAEANFVPPPVQRPPKNSPYRKKHV